MSRSNDVDVIGLDPHSCLDLMHGHVGMPTQNLGDQALMIGRQMQDDDIGNAAVGWRRPQKLSQRLNASRGGANSHNGKSELGAIGEIRRRGDVRSIARGGDDALGLVIIFCHKPYKAHVMRPAISQARRGARVPRPSRLLVGKGSRDP